jgi:ribosomal protein L11 methyltransferase
LPETNATPGAAPAHKLTLAVEDRDLARSVAGLLQDVLDPAPDALTLFEQPPHGWRIDAYYADPPDAAALGQTISEILGRDIPALDREAVPDLNWVALSQAALPPVYAGRFVVHGSHDCTRVPRGPNAILIDAGEAFGTAHHATTYGCLLAISRLTRQRRFRNILDLGCGSGVLAIAASRALPHARLLATDLDAQSVVVARANMHANAAPRIRTVVANGLAHPEVRRRAPFDLLIANILAGPLVALARPIATAVRGKGIVVLSGLLIHQAREVIAAYRAAGFRLEKHDRISGWSTLTLAREPGPKVPAPAKRIT